MADESGVAVVSRGGEHKGLLFEDPAGVCGEEWCNGNLVRIEWEDGEITYACTKGMEWTGSEWRIM